MVLVTSFRSPPAFVRRERNRRESGSVPMAIIAQLNEAGAPRVVPPTTSDANWTVLMQAELDYLRNRITKQPLNPATLTSNSMLAAYARGDVATSTRRSPITARLLTNYQQSLDENRSQFRSSGVAKVGDHVAIERPTSKSSSTSSAPSTMRAVLYVSHSFSASCPG